MLNGRGLLNRRGSFGHLRTFIVAVFNGRKIRYTQGIDWWIVQRTRYGLVVVDDTLGEQPVFYRGVSATSRAT